MSVPDTYRPPPTPIPYDVVLGRPQFSDIVSIESTNTGAGLEKSTCMDLNDGNCRSQLGFSQLSPMKVGIGLPKLNRFSVSVKDEEDACPTCLEEYDAENPKIVAKCNHHFHLSCILEWMERSSTCPICDQEMIYETF